MLVHVRWGWPLFFLGLVGSVVAVVMFPTPWWGYLPAFLFGGVLGSVVEWVEERHER